MARKAVATYYPAVFKTSTDPVPHTRLVRGSYYRWMCPNCKAQHKQSMLHVKYGDTGRKCSSCLCWVSLATKRAEATS